MKKELLKTIFAAALILLFGSCQNTAVQLPEQYEALQQRVTLFPDYTNIVVPPNIAPLNFIIKNDSAKRFVVEFAGENEPLLVGAGNDGFVQLDSIVWRGLLQKNRNRDITVTVYARLADKWVSYPSYSLRVVEEEIDPYLSYRLIEPGYELYRHLGIYQRNLTNWDVHTIYENNRNYEEEHNHCINCHNFCNYSTENMLFHVRSMHGGTVMIEGDKAHKVQIKDSSIISSGVYPSWHPSTELVAFSTNQTGQAFHLYHSEKVEVMDMASDLLLYDVKKNEVSHILKSNRYMETFPNWSPDGKYLYYCSARVPDDIDLSLPDSIKSYHFVGNYQNMHYNLMRMSFNPQERTFGKPEVVVDAAGKKRSITFPRVSPDGRYVLYAQGNYGQFHIWHKSSDLWVKDLETDTCYTLRQANSSDVESYHSWSSNGRWIVFSSRRMDKNYTRPYIAYFDKEGKAHKAFVLPQEDPEHHILLLKSYNVPELTKDAVKVNKDELFRCVYETEGDLAKYIQTADSSYYADDIDAYTGGSLVVKRTEIK